MANILFENEVEDFEIEESLWKKIHEVVDRVIETEEFFDDAEVSLTFVDEETIRELNRDYRGKDAVTDVLSFPMYEGLELQEMTECYEDEVIALGDIVLCIDRAKQQAQQYGHSPEREICFLICHSMFHLFGYDHEEEEERLLMRAKEEEVLTRLNLTR